VDGPNVRARQNRGKMPMTCYWPLMESLAGAIPPGMREFVLDMYKPTPVFVKGPAADDLFRALWNVATNVPPVTGSLEVVQHVGGPDRRLYLTYPRDDEWLALERGGLHTQCDTTFFLIDCLH
jgi:hypothetical protein